MLFFMPNYLLLKPSCFRSIVIFLLFVSTSSATKGQKAAPEITWGDISYFIQEQVQTSKVMTTKTLDSTKIIGEDAGGFYVKHRVTGPYEQKFAYWLEKYSFNDLKLLFSKEVELEKMESGNPELLDLYVMEGDVVAVAEIEDKRNDQYLVYAKPLTKEGIYAPGSFKVIGKSPVIASKELCKQNELYLMYEHHENYVYELVDKLKENPHLFTTLSPDKSKLLLFYDHVLKNTGQEAHAYQVYDGSLNLVKEGQATFDYPILDASVKQIHVDNAGNVYSYMKLFPDNARQRKIDEQRKTFHKIITYTTTVQNKAREFQIRLENNEIQTLKLTSNQQLDLVICGTYGPGQKEKGTFVSIFNPQSLKETPELQLFAFDTPYFNRLDSIKSREKGRQGKFKFRLLHQPNGNIALIAEYTHLYGEGSVSSSAGGYEMTTSPRNDYKDLLFLLIGKEKKIYGPHIIEKNQHVIRYEQYCSYLSAGKDEQWYFTYYDPGRKANFSAKRSNPVVIRLNAANGDQTHSVLFEKMGKEAKEEVKSGKRGKNVRLFISEGYSSETGTGTMILYNRIYTDEQFVKIEF